MLAMPLERDTPTTVPPNVDDERKSLSTADMATSQNTRTSSACPDPLQSTAVQLVTIEQRRAADRYHIVGEHGRGGLGRVLRAHDRELERDVAIKELIARNHISELRFFREALITARLEHPGIVPVHEAGRWPDGRPFYAMKLVAGLPLRDLIAERATPRERLELLHHVIAVADALAYAHDRNIIHRDLKPANIIVGDFGETVVIDWGLAKDLTTSDEPASASALRATGHPELTTTGSVLGTPAYMAPEQERGEAVDQRADVFAIGAMLWELCSLSKVPPLERRLRHRMLRREGVDPDLITILDKCLAAGREQRYPDAGALAADLKAFKAGARIAARDYSLPAMLVHWTRRHRALTFVSVSILTIALVTSTFYVRNIAKERNTTAAERDRAQLSEAAMWLEKDPTHARDLLRASYASAPQRALLLAQAEDRAATHLVHLDSRVINLQVDPVRHAAAIVTSNGTLFELDIDGDTLNIVDHDLNGSLVAYRGRWCYARQTIDADPWLSAGCRSTAVLGTRLHSLSGQLISASQDLYLLDAGDLAAVEATRLSIAPEKVRGFAASDVVTMLCTVAGQLTIARLGQPLLTSTCVSHNSPTPLAVRGAHFVALSAPNELISDRGPIALPVAVTGNFMLAIGDEGQIALADFTGDAWVVPSNSKKVVRAAVRKGHPDVANAAGDLVAFGYSDGAVVVGEPRSQQTWTFVGHASYVAHVVLDPQGRRVISGGGDEVRIWSLHTATRSAVELPCRPFHIEPTGTAHIYALDCNDGRASLWTESEPTVRELHRHSEASFGIARWDDKLCTGGWDGRVLCTSPIGGQAQEVLHAQERVKWLVSCGDQGILAAAADGTVWQTEGQARLLYRHHASPYRLAVDVACQHLVSIAYDGSLIAYNLMHHRIIAQVPHAHDGAISSVEFAGDDVVTAGADGTVKRWHLDETLRLVRTTSVHGPLSKLHLLDDGWVASLHEQTLALYNEVSHTALELAVSHPITDVAVSSDQRYVAFSALDEIVVLDRQRHALAAPHNPSSDFLCLQFLTGSQIAACDTAGVMTLDLEKLNFVDLP
ncbi:MAG TPA: serine/threonine-protein kinase [Kofleriaceae bacterium]|nr:serine/threonine-protein kinase [Kofleriaceae bacterium]